MSRYDGLQGDILYLRRDILTCKTSRERYLPLPRWFSGHQFQEESMRDYKEQDLKFCEEALKWLTRANGLYECSCKERNIKNFDSTNWHRRLFVLFGIATSTNTHLYCLSNGIGQFCICWRLQNANIVGADYSAWILTSLYSCIGLSAEAQKCYW